MTVNSALLTDFYQLTMAYGYWRLGMAEREATFHLFYRHNPFQSNYVISCGLASVVDYLANWRFVTEELDYLATIRDMQGLPLFSEAFLTYLQQLHFTGDVYAIPEGQLIFPNEPVLRVQGPILQAQLIETPLVNRFSFASLIATKASRVCAAAKGDPVIEFGLRRAQGPDGGMTASRAAFVGGCEAVSNTLAAKNYGIPVRGTMAHSWVMAFADELTAFTHFAQVEPGNTVLLVDTYDTIQGIDHAIRVGQQLRLKGKELLAVRLDSGDLNALSRQARQRLNAAGFAHTKIMASGDLDEYIITQLKQLGASIDIWGVGTRMTTAYDHPALDMVYKLSAIRDEQGVWQYKIKLSNQADKTTNPGIPQVRRFYQQNRFLADIIYDSELGIADNLLVGGDHYEDLLQPIFQKGKLIYDLPSITTIQRLSQQQRLQFTNSEITNYSVQLEPRLQRIKDALLAKVVGGISEGSANS